MGFWKFAVGPQRCTLRVLCIRDGTQVVHPWGLFIRGGTPVLHRWGFVNSQSDPSGAHLGFCLFAVGPQYCIVRVF